MPREPVRHDSAEKGPKKRGLKSVIVRAVTAEHDEDDNDHVANKLAKVIGKKEESSLAAALADA